MSTAQTPAAIVYTRPGCSQCDATIRVLGQKSIPHQVVNIDHDKAAAQIVAGISDPQGMPIRQLPIVTYGGDAWGGFRPDKLNSIAV